MSADNENERGVWDMVDLAVREETTSLLEVVSEFAADRVRPEAAGAEQALEAPPELGAALLQIGVVPGVDEAYGGQGRLSPEETFLIAEALGHGDPGIALELLSTAQAALLVDLAGDDDQRGVYLPRLAAGAPATVLYYEGYGRGPAELATTAERDGEDWVLTGRKIAAVRPTDAQLAVVIARTADGPGGFVLDRADIEELTLWRDDQASGKLGLRAARTGVVDLQVRLSANRRLAGDGLVLARAVAQVRLQLGALVLGASRASVEHARAYADQRVAFGKPIIDYQGVAFPLADVALGIEANRLNLLALLGDLGQLDDVAAIERRATLALNRGFKAGLEATRIGVNTLGGHGFLMDHPQERWHRAVATLAAIDFDPLASDLDVI